MKYYTINKFAKIIGVTPQTLRNWDRSGRLHPHHTSTNGYRYYSEEQLCAVTGIQFVPRKVIGYCRVSSRKQKDDLERQVENLRTYLYAQGNPFEIITDIGSGINYTKKGLQELIRRIEANQVKIHFPPSTSEAPDAHKKIQISAKDGKRTSRTIISLSRTFREELSK